MRVENSRLAEVEVVLGPAVRSREEWQRGGCLLCQNI